jgi:hypothetical protein
LSIYPRPVFNIQSLHNFLYFFKEIHPITKKKTLMQKAPPFSLFFSFLLRLLGRVGVLGIRVDVEVPTLQSLGKAGPLGRRGKELRQTRTRLVQELEVAVMVQDQNEPESRDTLPIPKKKKRSSWSAPLHTFQAHHPKKAPNAGKKKKKKNTYRSRKGRMAKTTAVNKKKKKKAQKSNEQATARRGRGRTLARRDA